MDDEQWDRIKDLFHAVLEQPPAHRASFIQSISHGDEALTAELESLLEAWDEDPEFLERRFRRTN